MAVLSNNTTKKDDNDQQLNLTGQPSGATGTGGIGMGQAKGPASSGQFTNVQSYVGANKNAGSKIAGAIGQRLNTQIGQAEGKAQGVANYNSKIQDESNRLGEGATFQQQVKDNPIGITDDSSAAERFSKLFNQQNTSELQKAELSGLNNTATQALQGVGQKVAGLANESGRFGLLREALGRPNYTQGQQRLDQALFQIGGADQLAGLQRDASGRVLGATDALGQSKSAMDALIQANITKTGQVSNDLRNTLIGEDAAFKAAQNAEAQKLVSDRSAQNTAISKFLSQGVESLSPTEKQFIQQQLAQGGVGFDQRTYNVDLNNFKQMGNTNVSDKDVVDANELARYNALLKLSEADPSSALYTAVGNSGANSGIKGAELGTALQGARTSLLNRFSNENIFDGGPSQSGGFNSASHMTGNLGNFLNSYETSNPNYQVNAGNINRSGAANWNRDAGWATSGQENLGNFADQNFNSLWSQFLNRLDQEGYNKTVGQITPR